MPYLSISLVAKLACVNYGYNLSAVSAVSLYTLNIVDAMVALIAIVLAAVLVG